MDVRALLPKDKHDDSTIPALLALSDREIEPILPELLTWVQDLNWPISGGIIEVIGKHRMIAEPFIIAILRGTDEVWKYNILAQLIYEWPTYPGNELASEIVRIAQHPTLEEIEAEVDKVADEFMKAYA